MEDPVKKTKRKKLKEEIFMLQNTKRSGAWVTDPNLQTLVRGDKMSQREHKKSLKQKIKEVRAGL